MRTSNGAAPIRTTLAALLTMTACTTTPTPSPTPATTTTTTTTTSNATPPTFTLDQIKVTNPRKTTGTDICSLITQDIANRIARSAPEQPARKIEDGPSCTWSGSDAMITVNTNSKQSIVESSRNPLSLPGEIVEIFGNTAWQHKRGRTKKEGCEAFVAVHSSGKTLYVVVDTFGFTPLPDPCATVKELAEITLAALPRA